MASEDEPPPAPSRIHDFCSVFLVELERGPSGLGMGLIDGLVSGPGLPSLVEEAGTWDRDLAECHPRVECERRERAAQEPAPACR